MRIALLSCENLPEPDHDAVPLLEALAAEGATAEVVPWDGDYGDLSRFNGLVLRATWNYPERPEEFRAFLELAARSAVLVNPIGPLRKNLHKEYLLELQSAGVATVPTVVVRRGESWLIEECSWSSVVVKPAISCGSYRTKMFESSDPAAQAFLDELAGERDTLVQPQLSGFRDPGERALVWIDGKYSHGMLKQPRFAGQEESVTVLSEVSSEDLALAESALALAGEGIVYARVDIVTTEEGPVVSELECLEPSLFFWARPQAAGELARAIVREARAGI
jgi:glutathione synthase/RimK-type ligase-like ATP-grasp enzyme